ncbi:response regulator [Caulobacter sp. 73W]|uniref:Response regulator n=1 Tax=Caulobacter sp. 73W TaxID=3161137 RepID=A0AB39KXC5_9CAUL
MSPAPRLDGLHVLVVEDEYYIAREISAALARAGATVVGPASCVADAMALLVDHPIDCAVLDINLQGARVLPLAKILNAEGVGVVFATGYDREAVEGAVEGGIHLMKPVDLQMLLRSIADQCAAR